MPMCGRCSVELPLWGSDQTPTPDTEKRASVRQQFPNSRNAGFQNTGTAVSVSPDWRFPAARIFTKHGSWLNMIEGFFGKMTKQMLRGIRVKSKVELMNRIYLYFQEVNAEPVVFHWKYNLDDIDVSEQIIVDTLPLKKSS